MKLFFAFLFFFMSSVGWAKEPISIRIGYIDFPPFYMRSESGIATGFLSERVEQIVNNAGLKSEMVFLPTLRMVNGIKEGEIDVWMGVAAFPDFQTHAIISQSIFFKMNLQTWYLDSSLPKINSPEDLKGKKVITLFGYSYGGLRSFLEDSANNITIIEVRSTKEAILALNGKRGDYILQYEAPMEYYLKLYPNSKIQSHLFKSIDCHIVVSKKNPRAKLILKKLERGLKVLESASAKN